MIAKEDILTVLNVAANIAQEESHRLEMSASRADEEEDNYTAQHFRHKASTARKIEHLIREADVEHFNTLRVLMHGPEGEES